MAPTSGGLHLRALPEIAHKGTTFFPHNQQRGAVQIYYALKNAPLQHSETSPTGTEKPLRIRKKKNIQKLSH